MTNIEKYSDKTFESIKKMNEYGAEYWFARDLQEVLEYKKWDKFIFHIIKPPEFSISARHNNMRKMVNQL